MLKKRIISLRNIIIFTVITDFTDEEDEALKAMEEVTMKFNIDSDDEHDMHMIENTSVNSEDVDLDLRRQRPPCNFVAPPPPTEPPPDDSEPVDLSSVVSQVDTVDIGVGDATTSPGPDSAKNSPRSESSKYCLKYIWQEFWLQSCIHVCLALLRKGMEGCI